MVSKEEAKIKLRKAGYNLAGDNAVITILVSEGTNIKNVVKNVKEIFVKIGYEASFGVRQTSSDIVENDAEAEKDYINEIEELEEESVEELIEKPVEKVERKTSVKKEEKTSEKKEETDYFDDEDEDPENMESKIELDALDMDMLLNEDNIQFSLEDFGMM